ncbi:ABC transporter permease subunit [Pseudooceanicola sp. 216_PA32_1]|uniref:ABC transporter permease subunit n=1 Tax=Pseudooceanicola pacificus TaxID=2676438 RepID=A0A844WBN3_9RHOB|nr:ABC transporter permease [Pseudooceanicola pacificus]MWB78268.1 ABC transporter permease subunit [Pseudooceanicola pacificus]
MTIFIIRRLVQSVILLWIVSIIAFLAVYLIGNPVDLIANDMSTPAEREAAMRTLGLDRPLYVQYLTFVGRAVHLDFGTSFMSSLPVSQLIFQRLPATVELTIFSFLISLLGLPLGVFAGLYPKSRLAKFIMSSSILCFSLPSFWIGLMAIMVFSVYLGWLPSTGRGETVSLFGVSFALTWSGLRHLVLPGVVLALFNLALLIRMARNNMLEVISTDFVRFARAKGVSERRVIWVHAMRNIMIPIITIQGAELAQLLTGALVVEQIFGYPGIGRLAIEAINTLDRPVLVAYMMLTVSIFVLVNLIVDILYGIVDPRIRLGGAHD